MEGSESAINRFGRAIWTVWGYVTGTVGRYLRPEVTNEEARSVQEDTAQISKCYKELKAKEEEKERAETKPSVGKTREDLQYSRGKVRAAAVQWEKGNIAHGGHEVKDKSKHTWTSSEGSDRKLQMRKDNKKTLDNQSGNQFTEQEDLPAYIDADIKNQDRTFCGSKDTDLNVERGENSQEQKRISKDTEEGVDEIKRTENYETGEETIKSGFIEQGLPVQESDLSVDRNEKDQDQRIKPEEEEKSMGRDFDEREEERLKNEFIDKDLLNKEANLDVEMSENSQEQRKNQGEKEDGVEIIRSGNDETEEEPIKHVFTEQVLLAKEADLNVERNENNEEERRTIEEEEEEKSMRRETDETEEEKVMKSEFIDKDLLIKADDLNVELSERSQEQRRKSEAEGVEIMSRENDGTRKEPIKGKLSEQVLLAMEADLNTERNENSQEQRRKQEEEEEEEKKALRRDFHEHEEEQLKCEFIDQSLWAKEVDLNVEMSENSQEQRRKHEKKEEVVEIMRRENDETEEEQLKRKCIEQGLLAKEADLNDERIEKQSGTEKKLEDEAKEIIMGGEINETEEEQLSDYIDQDFLTQDDDLNVEMSESSQEQREILEEEAVDELMSRENDGTGEEPIKSKFTEQDLVAMKADLDIERNENNHEMKKKHEKGEGVEEASRREYDETEEELIRSGFTEQGLLAEEADLNVERNENYQEQRRKQEEDDEEEEKKALRRDFHEHEEQQLKCEFIDQSLWAKEVDLNVEMSENSQEQRRKHEKEEEGVEIMRRENDETEEQLKLKCIEQGLLAGEADLNDERNENNQEQRRKPEEEEEGVDEISRRAYDETNKEPGKGKFIEQGLDPKEQAGVYEMRDTVVIQEVSVEKIAECVYDNDRNDLNVVEPRNDVKTEHENEASNSQMVDEGLFIQLASPWEGRDLLNDDLKLKVEMTDNAILLQEKEATEVDIEEAKQETMDEYHEEFSVWTQFTGTENVEEQNDSGTEMKDTLKQIEVIDRHVDAECEQLETAQIENAEPYTKEPENNQMFEDDDNNLAITVKLQQLEQSNEEKETSELALNVDLRQLDDTTHDQNGSQRPIMTKQDGGVISRPETEAGNQTETFETTSKCRAEVVAVDLKKLAERETSSNKQPIDREDVTRQELMDLCLLEQGSLLEESADPNINKLSFLEAPFSEIKSVPLEQKNETAVESIDKVQSFSLPQLDECSNEAELNIEAMSSSPEQTAEVFETVSDVTGMSRSELKCEILLVEDNCDNSILHETPLEDQINWDAEASSHRLQIGLSEALYSQEMESEQETLEVQRDSQMATEEQERTDEAVTELLEEIKDVASCLGVVENVIELTKESEDNEQEFFNEMEAPERKEHKSEFESHEEMSESNMNVELLDDMWECEKELEAGMTDIEHMVVSRVGEMESVKKMEEPITEEEKDKHQLVFPEPDGSKEFNKEHEESTVDSKENAEERGKPGLKRGIEKMAGDNDNDKPSVLTDLSLPSQASSLDFTVQKAKIAVKNPLVRPPKDPRMLINMASVEPLTPPPPSQPSFLKKSHIEGASVPSKGVIGFKLPGLGSGFPALRKTDAGRKIQDGEDSESVASQKSDSGSQSAGDNVKQETSPHKPKWTPPKQPGMGSPLMMAELKSKLKKPVKE